MSNVFRELLKQVGSGTHTSESLTREQAKDATMMMLKQEATPAQIGAFMIAHRIKRPTPTELAGMLDAYDELGPKLKLNSDSTTVVFGNPYDGRSRTAPVTPITALMLAAVGIAVIMHGGDTMPTKYGIPLIQIWQRLGVDFTRLSLAQTENCLATGGVGFVYTPKHFILTDKLVPYRDQIGKRPPLATLELIWNPTTSNGVHLVAGFVHPPTETRFLETFKLRDIDLFTTVKGLEGSCDLALSRTAIVGLGNPNQPFERLHLNSRDYDLGSHDIPLESLDQLIQQLQVVLQGKPSNLTNAAIYNGGFYLWRCGICEDVDKGFELAESMLVDGKVRGKLQQLVEISK